MLTINDVDCILKLKIKNTWTNDQSNLNMVRECYDVKSIESGITLEKTRKVEVRLNKMVDQLDQIDARGKQLLHLPFLLLELDL